jgi:hypothetical protein
MCTDVHEELVIGNIKTGEVFTFIGVGFTALADFNFWAAFNAYNLDDGYTEESGLDFCDFLANCELAKSYPAEVEGKPELAAELAAAGKLWESYDAAKQLTLTFEEFTNLVSIEDLKEFATLVPNAKELGLNDPQILTLASNLAFSQQGTEIRQFIKMAQDVGNLDKEFLVDCVRAINFARIKAMDEATMAKQGYTVRAVFPTAENDHDFAYSENGDEKVSWDAFAVMRGLSCRTLAVFVDNFITLASQDEDFDPLQINEQCGKLSDGRPLRLKAIEANGWEAHKAGFCPDPVYNSHRIIQILVPDGNNVLPDEEGYDATSFPQPMFPLTANGETLN